MLTIRTFQPTDAEAVRQLFARGQLDFALGTDLEAPVRAYIDRSLSEDLADIPANYQNHSGNNFWVADLAGQVRGMVGIQKRSEAEAELRRMSVARDSRRQGIGWKLLETVEEFCREHGYSQIFLTTVSQLVPAISMYQKYGFQLSELERYGVMSVHRYIKYL
ncbi:MAG TPA: GNAT family N-acetyltransferase [Dehalococcoidia bacterium]|nr:GNAT family N-acetyltransferase [Dehalococcoidia bacterium]